MEKYFYIILAGMVLVMCVYIMHRKFQEESRASYTMVVKDTIIVHDTVEIITLVPVKEYIKELVVEKVPVMAESSEKDSAHIVLPITVKVYEDSLYRAVVSGYKASLDSLDIYRTTTFINSEIYVPQSVKQKPHWSLGVQVGYGTDFQRFSPYIGIGIQYNIFSW